MLQGTELPPGAPLAREVQPHRVCGQAAAEQEAPEADKARSASCPGPAVASPDAPAGREQREGSLSEHCSRAES